jgi:hypothetical protein
MTTVEALKKLTSVIVGGTTAADIPGETIPEIIDYLANNYPGGGAIEALTVTSVAGSTIGATKVTVNPTLTAGNSYVYKTNPSTIDAPTYHETITGGTAWNGTDEIEADDGHHIGIYELNSNGQCVKFGDAIIHIKLT